MADSAVRERPMKFAKKTNVFEVSRDNPKGGHQTQTVYGQTG
jgi:hypothetical protein